MTIIDFIVVNFLLLMFLFAWVMKLRDWAAGTKLEGLLKIVIGIPAIIFDWYVNTFAASLFFIDPPEDYEFKLCY